MGIKGLKGPQVYISHHLHSHGSLFAFAQGRKWIEDCCWRRILSISFPQKNYICLTSLLARYCSIILKKIYFFVIDKSTQRNPFWDKNWVCKSFSLTTVGCVEELHFWEEREGYCNFSQNVLKKERGSFCNLLQNECQKTQVYAFLNPNSSLTTILYPRTHLYSSGLYFA